MKLAFGIVVLLGVLLVVGAVPKKTSRTDLSIHLDAFHAWAHEHGKVYKTHAALEKAFTTYTQNSRTIDALNSNPDDGAEYGHNRFSDLSPQEFAEMYLQQMVMNPAEGKRGAEELPVAVSNSDPTSYDWRDYNAVSAVKDQSSCGSCWAESAVQNIESVTFIKGGSSAPGGPTPLSVEQVVECDPHDYACYGGYPKGAYQYILENGGLASEADYPYDVDGKTICLANQTFNETCGDGMCDDPPLTGYCDRTCSDSKHSVKATISSWKALPSDEGQLASFLATSNPISVALDASGRWGPLLPWLQFYKKGVANPKHCSTTTLDHAVLLVGFGSDGDVPYWTVKNSWGAKWGEDGYFRLARGEGKCGINTMATTAIA